MTRFALKREISLGDLLTPISILVSLVAVLITWENDRAERTKAYADGIRHSCSTVSAKLQRWGTLADRYFDDIQPVLITVAAETAQTHTIQPARRDLYRGLMDAEGKASQRIVDEQLEIAYMELYGYVPSLRPPFDGIRERITEAESDCHERLAAALQSKIMDQKLLQSNDSKDMGNALRAEVKEERNKLDARIRAITDPLSSNLLKLINLSDEELVDSRKRAAESKIFENMSGSAEN